MNEFKEKIDYNIHSDGQKRKRCKIINCEHDYQINEMCMNHHNIIMNICTDRSCKETALDDGSKKCINHRGNLNLTLNAQIKYKILPSGHNQRLCYVIDCEKAARKGGLCSAHKNIKACSIDTCLLLANVGKEFCEDHSKEYTKCSMCRTVLNESEVKYGMYCDDCGVKHKEKRSIRSAKYRDNNKETIAESRQIHYNNNKIKINEKTFITNKIHINKKIKFTEQ